MREVVSLTKRNMSNTERHIIESYAGLFSGLSTSGKLELIESLTRAIKSDSQKKESRFFEAFGAFASSKPAEEIVEDIKASRKFRDKNVSL